MSFTDQMEVIIAKLEQGETLKKIARSMEISTEQLCDLIYKYNKIQESAAEVRKEFGGEKNKFKNHQIMPLSRAYSEHWAEFVETVARCAENT